MPVFEIVELITTQFNSYNDAGCFLVRSNCSLSWRATYIWYRKNIRPSRRCVRAAAAF